MMKKATTTTITLEGGFTYKREQMKDKIQMFALSNPIPWVKRSPPGNAFNNGDFNVSKKVESLNKNILAI